MLSAARYFVLVLVGLTVVDHAQLLQIVDRTLRNSIHHSELGYSCGLVELLYAQCSHEAEGCFLGRLKRDVQGFAVVQHTYRISREGDAAGTCVDSGRQSGYGLVDVVRSFKAFVACGNKICALYHIFVAVACDGHRYRCVELVQSGSIHINGDRLILIVQMVSHAPLHFIRGVELQVFHNLLCKGVRLQNLHLVVDTSRVGNDAQVAHVLDATRATAAVVVLDKHLGIRLVDGLGVAQIKVCTTQTNNQRDDEPVPVKY